MLRFHEFLGLQTNAYLANEVIENRSLKNLKKLYFSWYTKYYVQNLVFFCVFIISLLLPREKLSSDNFFIVHHKKFYIPPSLQMNFFIKLYPWFFSSIFLLLPRHKLISLFKKSVYEFYFHKLSLKKFCNKRKWRILILQYGCSLSLMNYFIHVVADEFFHYKSLSKFKVQFSAHFEPIVGLLSNLRQDNIINQISMYQHGCFEIPLKDQKYEKYHFDDIILKYSFSKEWIQKNFVKKVNCKFHLPTDVRGFYENLYSKNFVLAYCSSGETIVDNSVCELIRGLVLKNDFNVSLIFYPHPTSVVRLKKSLSKSFVTFMKKRHHDIDLCVTNISSIGFDYLAIGVRTLFYAKSNLLGEFETNQHIVHEDLDSLENAIKLAIISAR